MKDKNKDNSPKTPGGISKSLLTPCRRVGLSRKWKGASPSFISPLAGNQNNIVPREVKEEKKESRKRKQRVFEEENEDLDEDKPCTPNTPINRSDSDNIDNLETNEINNICAIEKSDSVSTPVSHVKRLARKKSKIIASLSKKVSKDNLQEKLITTSLTKENLEVSSKNREVDNTKSPENVSTPVRSKSKSKTKKDKSLFKNGTKNEDLSNDSNEKEHIKTENSTKISQNENIKQKSPNELTKECIVVIQKKFFKVDKNKCVVSENKNEGTNSVSQTLFDSDTDDVPLSRLNKPGQKHKTEDLSVSTVLPNCENTSNNSTKQNSQVITIDDDSDFDSPKVNEEERIIPNTNLKQNKESKNKTSIKKQTNIDTKPSQCSFDDDDDFDFENKKTILIRKIYEKPSRLSKAKSTGSITQKDIDDLKARIKMKKKLLLAKAMCKDTEELRSLIKKWQKGCQDALMELMELMRNKFPERQNMDYSEMLQLLRIPPALVGYDSENEIFNTPDDANVVLSKFYDL